LALPRLTQVVEFDSTKIFTKVLHINNLGLFNMYPDD